MKKLVLILSIFIIVVLTGCSNSSSKLESLSLEELYNKMNNKESFIVYFAKDNTILEKKLNKVLEENNLQGYKINVDNISKEEQIKLQPQITYEDDSIVFIIEGKDPSKLSHVTSDEVTTKELADRLIDMKFINNEK